jgi:hypothetical protein
VSLTKGSQAHAAELSTTSAEGVRNTVWSFGLTGTRHSLKSGDSNELLGNSAGVHLGRGYVSDNWFANFSFDILLGPYEPTQQQQLEVDYFGTGGTVWLGFSAQTLNIRSRAGGYGFALGLTYADIVGRSLGKNRKESDSSSDTEKKIENSNLIDDYTMRITNFSLLPAVFFSWLEQARPRGNTPELLKTRIDGYILTIGIAMPLLISYQAKYTTRDKYVVREGADVPEIEEPSRDVTDSGRLRGYSLMINLTALLGT